MVIICVTALNLIGLGLVTWGILMKEEKFPARITNLVYNKPIDYFEKEYEDLEEKYIKIEKSKLYGEVLKRYAKGDTKEEIARRLGVGKGEVSLIINISRKEAFL
jgi:hypothetical protein